MTSRFDLEPRDDVGSLQLRPPDLAAPGSPLPRLALTPPALISNQASVRAAGAASDGAPTRPADGVLPGPMVLPPASDPAMMLKSIRGETGITRGLVGTSAWSKYRFVLTGSGHAEFSTSVDGKPSKEAAFALDLFLLFKGDPVDTPVSLDGTPNPSELGVLDIWHLTHFALQILDDYKRSLGLPPELALEVYFHNQGQTEHNHSSVGVKATVKGTVDVGWLKASGSLFADVAVAGDKQPTSSAASFYPHLNAGGGFDVSVPAAGRTQAFANLDVRATDDVTLPRGPESQEFFEQGAAGVRFPLPGRVRGQVGVSTLGVAGTLRDALRTDLRAGPSIDVPVDRFTVGVEAKWDGTVDLTNRSVVPGSRALLTGVTVSGKLP